MHVRYELMQNLVNHNRARQKRFENIFPRSEKIVANSGSVIEVSLFRILVQTHVNFV